MLDSIFYLIKNEWIQVAIQMFLAVLLGGVIGLEREFSGKTAGFRTYALVCLGSMMFAYMSTLAFLTFYNASGVIGSFDASRIASQVVVGIGFIGAGLIIHRRDDKVTGLTTAAGLWATAAVGMAVGFKLIFVAIFGTALILAVLWFFRIIEYRIIKKLVGEVKKEKEEESEDEY